MRDAQDNQPNATGYVIPILFGGSTAKRIEHRWMFVPMSL
jgi:hypothetical protein